jgi:hypothetical protein
MSFFITSARPGKGADLGGLDGADKYLPDAGAGGGLARLSLDEGRRRRPLDCFASLAMTKNPY